MRTGQTLRHTDTSSDGHASLTQDQVKILTLATVRALNALADIARTKSLKRKHLKKQKKNNTAAQNECIDLWKNACTNTEGPSVSETPATGQTDDVIASCSYTQSWSTEDDDHIQSWPIVDTDHVKTWSTADDHAQSWSTADDDHENVGDILQNPDGASIDTYHWKGMKYLKANEIQDSDCKKSEYKKRNSQKKNTTKKNKSKKSNFFELFADDTSEDKEQTTAINGRILDGFGNEISGSDAAGPSTEKPSNSSADNKMISDVMSDFSWAFTDQDKDSDTHDILDTCIDNTRGHNDVRRSVSDSQVMTTSSSELGYGCFSLDEEMEIQKGHIKGLLGKSQLQAKRNRATRKHSVYKPKEEISNVIEPIRRRKRIARPIRDALLVRSSMQKALKGCIGSCCGRGCWASWKWISIRHVMSDYE